VDGIDHFQVICEDFSAYQDIRRLLTNTLLVIIKVGPC
jgi:hypothetical protein